MTNNPTPTTESEKVFESTGIRVMTNKNGDILFNSQQEYFRLSVEAVQYMDAFGKAILFDKLIHYIQTHKKQPINTSFQIPTND